MARLFLSQQTIEDWAVAEKADIRDGKVWVTAENVGYPVIPAVHFRKLVSGSDDKKLLEKVKTMEQLAALGVEHMADSAIVGDAAYEVVEGYVAEVADKKKPSAETDLLAAFLLNKL